MARLINAKRSDIEKMSPAEFKQAIWNSEGRVVLSQNYVGMDSLAMGVTNPELAQAMGADMVFFNGYSCDSTVEMRGLSMIHMGSEGFSFEQYRIPEMRRLIDIPMGVYLECGKDSDRSNAVSKVRMNYMATNENIERLINEGVDFVVLGGNPGTGVKYDNVIKATAEAKRVAKDRMLVFSGKWEDGASEPVIGDPIKPIGFYEDIIAALIDAGADCICMPMPGSRWGIDVPTIRHLVAFVHTYKPGTLAMTFLDGTVEGSDVETIRQCALLSKQTGADIHAIGDAGLAGMSLPENIYQLCLTIKGRIKTWERMAASRR